MSRTHGKAAIARAHRAQGRDFELTNFRYDSEQSQNAYADGEWVVDDTATVPASIVFNSNHPQSAGAVGTGASVERDAIIYVLHDVDVVDGTDDESRATEFTDTDSETSYRAIAIENQRHLLAVYVEEI